MLDEIVIATGTVTQALKGKDVLLKNHYPAEIERMKYGTENYGCGYGIVTKGKSPVIENLLRDNNVKVLKILPKK